MVYAAAFCEESNEAAMKDMCVMVVARQHDSRPPLARTGPAYREPVCPAQGIRGLKSPERRAA
jgi:hypothetical protein